jgi:hypothetical protein
MTTSPVSLQGPSARLRFVKVVHTIVWASLATCVVAIPVLAWRRELGWAFALIGVLLVETLLLLMNDWRCPLTDIAARHTSDRRDNFDIYLPEWLARHNKAIFGGLYVAGVVLTLARAWSGR